MSLDKTPIIIPFLLPLLNSHQSSPPSSSPPPPFIIGITGVQGSGKSYLVDALHHTLSSPPHSLNITVFSFDDFYYPFSTLEHLRTIHPNNPLLSHRGEPGTHDIELLNQVLDSLLQQKSTAIPIFDKSLNAGRGDRLPETEWKTVEPVIDVVLLEGWCAGFRALTDEQVEEKWEESRKSGDGVLKDHKLENLLWINEALKGYDEVTDKFDAFIHMDAKELSYVYNWRSEQEHHLISKKGTGMTDQQVKKFIDGYMPGYELYLDNLRKNGCLKLKPHGNGKQLKIIMGKDRETISSEII